MKKLLYIALSITMAISLCACIGEPEMQSVSFQNFTIEIPQKWKVEKETLSDTYAVYEKNTLTGHDVELILMATETLSINKNLPLEQAGKEMKEYMEDDSTYSDVSDPVVGKFADKYDMHTITCTAHMKKIFSGKDIEYPCKYCTIYMGKYNVSIEIRSDKDDFKYFDAAIEGAKLN